MSSFQRASYNLRKCYFRFIFSESYYSTNMLSTSWKEILIAYPIIVWLLYSTFRYKTWDLLIYQDIFFYVQYYLLQTLWSSLHVVEMRTIFIYFFTSTEWTSVFPWDRTLNYTFTCSFDHCDDNTVDNTSKSSYNFKFFSKNLLSCPFVCDCFWLLCSKTGNQFFITNSKFQLFSFLVRKFKN